MSKLFSFPETVNEVSARLVATGVVAMAVLYLSTGWAVVLGVMTYGFWARVLTGPSLSPLGQIVTRFVTPMVPFRHHRLVSGSPKRFAQGIGVAFTTVASLSHLAGATGVAMTLIGLLLVAASLEAFAGYCLGCKMYGLLIRAGLRPVDDCPDCADISDRLQQQLVRPLKVRA